MQPQSQSRSDTPVSSSSTPGRSFTIVGFVLGVAALFVAAIPLGVAGAIFGGIGYSKGDKLGMWAMILSIVMAILGFVVVASMLS